MKNIFKWILDSNRPKHILVGMFIFTLMCLFQFLYCYLFISEYNLSLNVLIKINSLITTFIAMCSVEYIQSKMGGKWDWLDILAGIMVPVVLILVSLLILKLTIWETM